MKKKLAALLLACALVSGVLSGCRSDGENSSSVESIESDDPSSSMTENSATASETESLAAESSNSVSPQMESSSEATASAMSGDYTQLQGLDSEKRGWGPGTQKDEKGCPIGATAYQEKYGKYDADFIGPTDSKKIYLTFDEGYEYEYTPVLLDTLKEKQVPAVFFVTMDYVKRNPELVQRMIDEGHIVGNHSTRHKSFPSLSLQEAEKDITVLHDYVKENFDYEMTLFRFPMGEFSEQMLGLLQSLGYRSVFWSFAYVDWNVDQQMGYEKAFSQVTSNVHPGAIYLLHAVSKDNADILGEAIDTFRDQGYSFEKYDL